MIGVRLSYERTLLFLWLASAAQVFGVDRFHVLVSPKALVRGTDQQSR